MGAENSLLQSEDQPQSQRRQERPQANVVNRPRPSMSKSEESSTEEKYSIPHAVEREETKTQEDSPSTNSLTDSEIEETTVKIQDAEDYYMQFHGEDSKLEEKAMDSLKTEEKKMEEKNSPKTETDNKLVKKQRKIFQKLAKKKNKDLKKAIAKAKLAESKTKAKTDEADPENQNATELSQPKIEEIEDEPGKEDQPADIEPK